MLRLFLFLLVSVIVCAGAAHAASTSASIGVSITVLGPADYANKTGQAAQANAKNALSSPAQAQGQKPLVGGVSDGAYQRFAATDSAEKRGELFP